MWRMTVIKDEIIIAERSYYSANECCINMHVANDYYTSKGEKVRIEMKDKEKRLIASLESIQ